MNKKRILITAGVLILLGETACLLGSKNLIASAAVTAAAVMIILSNRVTGHKKCSYLLLFCCFAAGIGIAAVTEYEKNGIDLIVGEYVEAEGKITDVIEKESTARVTVKAGKTKIIVYIKEAERLPKVGEYISVKGSLEPPEDATNPGGFDAEQYYTGKGIAGVLYADDYQILEKKDYILFYLGCFRASMKESLFRYFREDRASLLSAILLGEKSGLDKNQKLLYQKNGLAHILAISGMHVSIIALAIEKILELIGVGRKKRYAAVIILVTLYGLMTGFDSPIVRAVIMLVMRYSAFFFKRSPDIPTDMMTALLIMAVINPYSVFTAGVQMSFAAAFSMYISDRIYINYFGWRQIIFMKKVYGMKAASGMSTVPGMKTTSGMSTVPGMKTVTGKPIKSVRQKRLREGAVRLLLSTLIINAFLSPLLIYYYYEIYPYSMLMGAMILSTVSYLIAGGFITALIGMVKLSAASAAARIMSYPVNGVLEIYERICGIGLKLPCSGINTGHTRLWIISVYYALIMLLVLMVLGLLKPKGSGGKLNGVGKLNRVLKLNRGGKLNRVLEMNRGGIRAPVIRFLTAAYIMLTVFLVMTSHLNRACERVVILDVGQGMSTIVHFSDGRNYILDGGSTSKQSTGEYVIIPALKYYGMSDITGIFVSHTDEDHINGLIEMSNLREPYRLRIGALYMADGTEADGNYKELCEGTALPVTGLSVGDKVDGRFTVIYPDSATGGGSGNDTDYGGSGGGRSGNDYSLVVLMESEMNGRNVRILFPGDISSEAEEVIVSRAHSEGRDISADILIAPHHGSGYSSSDVFLEAISPDTAVISCGKNNPYGHPARETLERIKKRGIKIYRTDKEGAVVIE